jgi:iron(III) transport system substrate-binding protein
MKSRSFVAKALSGVCAAAILFGAASAFAATELTVYTAIEADDLKRYAEEFNKQYPDIEIKWVRDSTGIVTAKLLAEKENPQADIVWGLAATSLMLLKSEGMTEPYTPAGADMLDKKFVDSDSPMHWTGMDAWVAAICVNTIEAEKNNLPMPTTWKDLLDPVYKGHVVMPNPNSSGTGFLDVSSWLQLYGEEGGWEFMDGLHENIAWYTHSGSKPCRQAGAGEAPIGISFAYRGAKVKAQGAPIEIIIPTEGAGWDMEATAIIKGTKNLEAAKKLADFSVSKEANVMYNSVYAVVAYPGVAQPVEHYPSNIGDLMIDNDFAFAASNRERILKEWQSRYDSKSEAK